MLKEAEEKALEAETRAKELEVQKEGKMSNNTFISQTLSRAG